MFEREIKKYKALNDLAEQGGIVIFGGEKDMEIPVCELKQAFSLDSDIYNRSIAGLSVMNAAELYEKIVGELHPDMVLLHIGGADKELFCEKPEEFDARYRELIAKIKESDKKCEIVIVSLKNYSEDTHVQELNRHIKYIAEAERCKYADISVKQVWNPRQTKDVVSFVYSTGFVRPLKNRRPVYDLVKILFCYEDGSADAEAENAGACVQGLKVVTESF